MMNDFHKLWVSTLVVAVLLGQATIKADSCSSSSSSFDCCFSSSSSCSSSSSSSCSSRSNDCCVSSLSDDCCEKRGHSRTILVPRNQTLDAMNELALNNYFLYHNVPCPEDRPFLHTQVSYFHKQSNNEGDLRRYFLKHNKNRVTVRQNGSGDVGSLWLGVTGANGNNFSSDFTICPKRKLDGAYFNFWADLNNWICGGWAAISFAAYRSEARTGFREFNIQNQGDQAIHNATTGFNNPAWRFGRLSNRCVTRHGVDDVQFKFGWNHYFCNDDHAGLYLVVVAPTGKCGDKHNDRSSDRCRTSCNDDRKRCGNFIWDPYIGSRHAGVGFGINTDWTLWECGNQGINWMADFKYIYRFKHTVNRLFDLRRNGDFSRYLEVATPNAPATALPGVNYLHQAVEVNPRSLIEFWTALHYEICAFNVEAGYNLFWRDSEKACFSKKCHNRGFRDNTIGIYDLSNKRTSASKAKISESNRGSNAAPSDSSFTYVRRADLDLRSGLQPQALTNTVYLGVSYNSEICCMPAMIGVSGSYEFAHNKLGRNCKSESSSDRCGRNKNRHHDNNYAAIEQWGVAVKGDLAF